nr:13164_t:CDS:2 [Entrophospora candida]
MFNLINSNYSNCQFIFDNGNKCNCWTSTKSDTNDPVECIKNHINELFNYAHPHQYGELTIETLKHNPYQPFNNKRRNNQDPDQNSSNFMEFTERLKAVKKPLVMYYVNVRYININIDLVSAFYLEGWRRRKSSEKRIDKLWRGSEEGREERDYLIEEKKKLEQKENLYAEEVKKWGDVLAEKSKEKEAKRVRLSIDSLSDLKRVILANEYPVTFVPFIAHPEIEKDICEIIHLNLMSLFSGGSGTGKTHIGFEIENIVEHNEWTKTLKDKLDATFEHIYININELINILEPGLEDNILQIDEFQTGNYWTITLFRVISSIVVLEKFKTLIIPICTGTAPSKITNLDNSQFNKSSFITYEFMSLFNEFTTYYHGNSDILPEKNNRIYLCVVNSIKGIPVVIETAVKTFLDMIEGIRIFQTYDMAKNFGEI